MTIRDVILAYPGVSDLDGFLDKVIFPNRGLTGDEDCSEIAISTQKLIAADLYSMVGGNADFTENKLSMTYPRGWYDKMAKRLYMEGGEPEKAYAIGTEVPLGTSQRRW